MVEYITLAVAILVVLYFAVMLIDKSNKIAEIVSELSAVTADRDYLLEMQAGADTIDRANLNMVAQLTKELDMAEARLLTQIKNAEYYENLCGKLRAQANLGIVPKR